MKKDLFSDRGDGKVSPIANIESQNLIFVPGSMTNFPKSQAAAKVPNFSEMADMMSS